jgi:UDP-3-O-[3-hydroxymyristoyl] glucosamine N-acyltransferase
VVLNVEVEMGVEVGSGVEVMLGVGIEMGVEMGSDVEVTSGVGICCEVNFAWSLPTDSAEA